MFSLNVSSEAELRNYSISSIGAWFTWYLVVENINPCLGKVSVYRHGKIVR